jgi:hypothetical protein
VLQTVRRDPFDLRIIEFPDAKEGHEADDSRVLAHATITSLSQWTQQLTVDLF